MTNTRKNFAIVYQGAIFTKVLHESGQAAKEFACDHFGFRMDEIEAVAV